LSRAAIVALISAAAAVLGGCAAGAGGGQPEVSREPASRLTRVEPGMSAAAARSLLGRPLSVERQAGEGGAETWYYEDGVLVFQGEAVVFSFAAAGPR